MLSRTHEPIAFCQHHGLISVDAGGDVSEGLADRPVRDSEGEGRTRARIVRIRILSGRRMCH